MRIVSVILFLLLVVSSSARGQQRKGNDRAEDTPDRKDVNGFGGQLLVVENPQAFIHEWLKPETPKIETAKNVNRDDTIGALVLFAGCRQSAQGECNAEVDYSIYNPDGSLFVELKKQPLWKEQAPPAPNIQLGKAILSFRMGDDQPAGEYRVKAKVSDLNADISFELETKFRLK
jgi:hypothetical protein